MIQAIFEFIIQVIFVVIVAVALMWISSLLHGSWPTGHVSFLFILIVSLALSTERYK